VTEPRDVGAKTNYERFAPPRDPTLAGLLEAVHAGTVQLYWAAVPIKCIRPFSATFNPADELWKQAVETLKGRIRAKDYAWMLVYQTGDFFVMSDDYPVYYAYLECESTHAPCYILGEPRGTHVAEARIASSAEVDTVLRPVLPTVD
jgi:hypothetical protein